MVAMIGSVMRSVSQMNKATSTSLTTVGEKSGRRKSHASQRNKFRLFSFSIKCTELDYRKFVDSRA